ncbi:MAG: hypothetical protein II415_09620, partial [Bacteroidaceae bacterium]|nr:hypothetical protein [Bacteroidaceae bacterium]
MANALSEKLGTEVTVGNVNLGFLNRLIIDDIYAEDLEGRPMLKVARTSASFNIISLLSGKIEISTAQLFGLTANLSKKHPDAPLNCQFVIDAFSSKEEKESSPLYLNINSLIVRHANLNFDVESEEKTEGKFNPNHLSLKDIGFTSSIRTLTNDSVNIAVKRLDFKEANSGLELTEFKTSIAANKQSALIDSLHIATPHSILNLGPTNISYPQFETNKRFSLSSSINNTHITPSDFKALLPTLSDFNTPISIDSEIRADQNGIYLNNTAINSQDE